MTNNNETLAAQLAAWRARVGQTREQAATLFGVTAGTIARWEAGKTAPKSVGTLAAVKRELASGQCGK